MKVRLVDHVFSGQSATLSDEREDGPKWFSWCREDPCGSVHTWFTDNDIGRAEKHNGPRKVGWLIESPAISTKHYRLAMRKINHLDACLTYRQTLVDRDSRFLFYPLGGSRIDRSRWGLSPKMRTLSIIASQKVRTVGHTLRHRVVKDFGDRISVWGRGYRPVDSLTTALGPYRYSIVIENHRENWYFSEKLIDCLSQGTVPIYWGCPDIGRFFNTDGIIQVADYEDLVAAIWFVLNDQEDWEGRLDAIKDNLARAENYDVAEDWIFDHYTELLT